MILTSYMVQLYSEHPDAGSKLKDEINGAVWFEFKDGDQFHYAACLFAKKKIGQYHNANVWLWNNQYDKISLMPSILFPDYKFHCYVTEGRIVLLTDSQVVNQAARKDYNEFFNIQEE